MRLELTGRHVEITPTLRRLVDTKLAKLERLMNDSAVSAQAVLHFEKNQRRADITLHTRGDKFLHGVGKSGTWDVAVGRAIDKIAQQAQKVKGKWQERKRRGHRTGDAIPRSGQGVGRDGAGAAASDGAPSRVRPRMPRILRASRQVIKPMTVVDAAREVETTDGIVVFRDPETSRVSVLYRRRDGELALVETEN
jgi:putative sigma-54 modulation protein